MGVPAGNTYRGGKVKDPGTWVSGEGWTNILREDELLRSKRRKEASKANRKIMVESRRLRYKALSDYFTHVDDVDIKYYWSMGAAPLFALWRIKWKLFEGPAICMVVFSYFRYVTYEDLRYFNKMNMFPGKKPRPYYIRSLQLKGHVQKVKVPSARGNHPRTIFVLTPLGAEAISDYNSMLDQTMEYLYKGKERYEKTGLRKVK